MGRFRNSWFVALLALGPLIVGLVAAIAWGLVLRGKYETEQSATRSFTIEQDFTVVRKILVRRDGAKQLVTMGGGSVFRSQEWDSVGGDVESLQLLDPKWRLELHGVLAVTTQDDYVGEQDIDLKQDVTITPDELHSVVDLAKPAERLRGYRMKTHFQRDPSGRPVTRVDLELSQTILTDAPWFAHAVADRRVRASVERTLSNQEAAIRRLVAENLDDVPLLPLR